MKAVVTSIINETYNIRVSCVNTAAEAVEYVENSKEFANCDLEAFENYEQPDNIRFDVIATGTHQGGDCWVGMNV